MLHTLEINDVTVCLALGTHDFFVNEAGEWCVSEGAIFTQVVTRATSNFHTTPKIIVDLYMMNIFLTRAGERCELKS